IITEKDRNLVTANGTAALEFAELILKGLEFDSKENIERQIYMYQRGFYEYCNKYGNPYQ
ncbi:glutamine amidotransferase, partial [Staphylococcus epidermidis]